MAVNRRRPQASQKKIQIGNGISVTQKNHDKLVKYVTDRLDHAKTFHDIDTRKYEIIDREIAGWFKRDYEDSKREKDNLQGKGPKPTDAVLGLILAQIDEAVTFLLTVLAPDEGIYTAVAPNDKQETAKGFSTLMNKHADIFEHYPQFALGLLHAMKYNFSGWIPQWEEVKGNKVVNNPSGRPLVEQNETVFSGNSHDAIDPYNFLFDRSVFPPKLNVDGEFFATVDLISPFNIKRRAAKGELFSIERFEKEVNGSTKYYTARPEIRHDEYHGGGNRRTDWFSVISMNSPTPIAEGFEEAKVYVWLTPKDFALATKDEMEIWRITLINGKWIGNAERLNNAHGMLPVGLTVPLDDGFFPETKSYSEWLVPLQRFASFEMNMHQRSARKELGGLTVYNKRVLPQLDNPDVDMTGGKIGVDSADPNFDINKHLKQFNDGPDTSRTLENIEASDTLMQKVLPTDLLKQVAGLERATQYQAAATVQGANRRNLKIGKIIDTQSLRHTRFMQMYNILEKQESMEILDPQGKVVNVNVKDFRDTAIEFLVHAGLRGLDKLSLSINMKEMFNSILQSQQAAQQIDVVELMDYLSSLWGDFTDMKQFKFKSPIDALGPKEKNLAFQLLQQFVQQQQGTGGEGGEQQSLPQQSQ